MTNVGCSRHINDTLLEAGGDGMELLEMKHIRVDYGSWPNNKLEPEPLF
jgi:hypothetical protein